VATLTIDLKGKSAIAIHDYDRHEIEDIKLSGKKIPAWLIVYNGGDKEIARYKLDEIVGYHVNSAPASEAA
jgi:hypothetical protein